MAKPRAAVPQRNMNHLATALIKRRGETLLEKPQPNDLDLSQALHR
jgi:hypothetical protein